ncbi:hypothetical protein [Edaphobacter bradus]|uniref:hypothetical protein n=1 Tax=Edaphobacter bradus TaxID=2259016 RepID=UPI0021E0C0E3|nr:hypothetical protein [Edaphobacter bradus]
MIYGRSARWLVMLLLLSMVLVVRSLVPHYELRSDPPSWFLAAAPRKYPDAQSLSGQYWQNARAALVRFDYGQPLPESQPPECVLHNTHLTPAQQTDLEHVLWKQLGVAWNDPLNWKKHYELDFGWIPRTVMTAGSKIDAYLPALKK